MHLDCILQLAIGWLYQLSRMHELSSMCGCHVQHIHYDTHKRAFSVHVACWLACAVQQGLRDDSLMSQVQSGFSCESTPDSLLLLRLKGKLCQTKSAPAFCTELPKSELPGNI